MELAGKPEGREGAGSPGVHRVAPGHLPTPRTSPQVLFPATRMLNVTKSVGNLARWPLPCVSIPVMSPQPGEEVYRLRLSSAALLSLPQSKHNKIRFFLVLCSSSRALRLRAALAWSAALARSGTLAVASRSPLALPKRPAVSSILRASPLGLSRLFLATFTGKGPSASRAPRLLHDMAPTPFPVSFITDLAFWVLQTRTGLWQWPLCLGLSR